MAWLYTPVCIKTLGKFRLFSPPFCLKVSVIIKDCVFNVGKCCWCLTTMPVTLQGRYDDRDGVSNHRRLKCLLNRLFRRRSKETSKLRVTGLREGMSPVTGEFPAQRASNAANVSIWWRHHDTIQPHNATLIIIVSIKLDPATWQANIQPNYTIAALNNCWVIEMYMRVIYFWFALKGFILTSYTCDILIWA